MKGDELDRILRAIAEMKLELQHKLDALNRYLSDAKRYTKDLKVLRIEVKDL